MRAYDWPVPGLTSLPRGAISLREGGWRSSALGAGKAPEAEGARCAVPSVRPGMPSEQAAGTGTRTHGTGSRRGTRWAHEGGSTRTGRGPPALFVGCVCVSVGPFWLSACARSSGRGARSGPSARRAAARGAHGAAVAKGGPFLSLVI